MEIFKILGTIAIDNEKANQALDETSEKAGQAGEETSGAFSKIGGAALTLGKMVVGAGVALGTAWVAAIEGSREYRTEMGKLDTAFATAGYTTQTATSAYKTLFGVIGETDQAVEAAQQIALLANSEKDVSKWSELAAGVVGRFGDALQPETFFESANETIKLGEATGAYVQMLEGVGMSVEDFNEGLASCSTESEKQAYMLGITKEALGDASKTYNEANKDIIAANKAQEKLTAAFAQLGAVGEPILTAIKDKVAQFVTAAVPHLENFIKKVKDLKKWIKENENTIDAWTAVIIGTTVAVSAFLLVLKWSAIMSAAKKAVTAVRSAVMLFNATLLANPIALVVALIAGLVAAFVYLWNNNKEFRTFWINLWDKIKSACGSAVTWIKNKFGDFKAALKTVKNTFGDIKNAITDRLDEAREKVSGIIKKIKGFFPLSIGKIFSNLKIPKITVSGGKAPFGIAGKGKLPSFDVQWKAKGAVFDQPTIFSTHQGLQGVGEAGPEAVAPVSVLQAYIASAVKERDETLARTIETQNQRMMDFLERIVPHDIRLDSNALVGELVPAIDTGLSARYDNARRGNVR